VVVVVVVVGVGVVLVVVVGGMSGVVFVIDVGSGEWRIRPSARP
jgi:hypothetical protein